MLFRYHILIFLFLGYHLTVYRRSTVVDRILTSQRTENAPAPIRGRSKSGLPD
jgi:hypothetical protein